MHEARSDLVWGGCETGMTPVTWENPPREMHHSSTQAEDEQSVQLANKTLKAKFKMGKTL